MNTESTAPVKAFFEAFGKGDFQAILDTFHPEITITAVREAERKKDEIYGTYKGTDGVKDFVAGISNAFDTQSFSVENVVRAGDVAFANGKFTHQLKSTGRLFSSDWVLYAKIKGSRIYEYHFYEDSAAFNEANKNG